MDYRSTENIGRREIRWQKKSYRQQEESSLVNFPSNEEFREALTEKDLYLTIRSKGVKYLLYALEEKSPFPKGLPEYTDETITIEHVMPQTPTERWKGYLSSSDLESYEVYLHRLGNLALTNYNSEMSNKSFDEKKEIYKGSKFYYTTKLSDVSKWSSAVISKRGGELADAALKVWNYQRHIRRQEQHMILCTHWIRIQNSMHIPNLKYCTSVKMSLPSAHGAIFYLSYVE